MLEYSVFQSRRKIKLRLKTPPFDLRNGALTHLLQNEKNGGG
jgi:hypothetical protein